MCSFFVRRDGTILEGLSKLTSSRKSRDCPENKRTNEHCWSLPLQGGRGPTGSGKLIDEPHVDIRN